MASAYIAVLLSMLFVTGMKMVIQDGVDYRKGLVVGVSFWAGVGFQGGVIFPEYFAEFAGGLLQNGMTAGGLVAILMTLSMELTAPRRRRLEVEADLANLPRISGFLDTFARRNGWDAAMAQRLEAAGEETLASLVDQEEAAERRRCCSSPARKMAAPCWSSSPPPVRTTSRTASPWSTPTPPRSRTNGRSRCDCCATSPRRSATSSTTTPKSSPSASTLRGLRSHPPPKTTLCLFRAGADRMVGREDVMEELTTPYRVTVSPEPGALLA